VRPELPVILLIMSVETFTSDVIVFIRYDIMFLTTPHDQ
jgi:hypothetical protein